MDHCLTCEKRNRKIIRRLLEREYGRGLTKTQILTHIPKCEHRKIQFVDYDAFNKALDEESKQGSIEQTTSECPKLDHCPTSKSIHQNVSVHSEIGGRDYQEDAHCIHNDDESNIFAVAVFDGHRGGNVSAALSHPKTGLLSQLLKDIDCMPPIASRSASCRLFERFDKRFVRHAEEAGSTATILVRHGTALALYNVGDSRTVLFDENGQCLHCTTDHTPVRYKEFVRIRNGGGSIDFDTYNDGCFRVSEDLNMSRAFGDTSLKRPKKIISAHPDVFVASLTDETVFKEHLTKPRVSFAVLGSDGLWDNTSTTMIGRYVARQLSKEVPLEKISKNLVSRCVKRNGEYSDNVTAAVVLFDLVDK